jgi:hypothetical protein
MFQILGEALSQTNIWLTILFLLAAGWLMERIITKMAFLCRSVHIIHVPWGILIITLLTYLNGYIDYKGVVVMALLYLVSYPSMWFLNYRFTRDLEEILRKKHVTQEMMGQAIWPEEIRWVWQIKRRWRKLTGNKLDDEVVSWILDYDRRNGISQRYGIPIKTESNDN